MALRRLSRRVHITPYPPSHTWRVLCGKSVKVLSLREARFLAQWSAPCAKIADERQQFLTGGPRKCRTNRTHRTRDYRSGYRPDSLRAPGRRSCESAAHFILPRRPETNCTPAEPSRIKPQPDARLIRPFDCLQASDHPDANRVSRVYRSVPESYRRLLPPEAFCFAAGVSEGRVLELIAGAVARNHEAGRSVDDALTFFVVR
jgi:hypothetical protein